MTTRRSFLTTLAVAVPSLSLVRLAHASAIRELAADPHTLDALGEAILPSELGSAGIARAIDGFRRWMGGYQAGAELLHGYGTSVLTYAGPTPAMKWALHLTRLDQSAKAAHRKPFASLGIAERQALVRDALKDTPSPSLGPVGRAQHVSVALLSHFYRSPDALDLCYNAHIGRQTCRPLAAQSRRPLPLAGGSRA